MDIVMISGHTDITQEQFQKYYQPLIDEYVDKGAKFIVGGAYGTDSMAQHYLATKNVDVTVYDKGDQNNVHDPEKFNHLNGFPSYPKRDAAMTENSTVDIAFLRNDRMAKGSGSCANIVRRVFGDKVSKKVFKLMRDKRKLDIPFNEVINKAYPDIGQDIVDLINRHTMD